MIIINEPGLYSVVLRGSNMEAKKIINYKNANNFGNMNNINS
ncbi:MAG: hypothetical protein PWR06_553 [Thermoanaerobacteraceae bacterium]|nr:hypothetical protein [Thermoanaerobacteraceae bacterium]